MRYRIFKFFNREHYLNYSFGFLFLCFIIQRIFRINSEFKYLVNYTSRIAGSKNIDIPNCPKVKSSFLTSGGCYFSCIGKLTIGKGTIFAPNITIVTANHDLKDLNKHIIEHVTIGENCWIGAGTVVLPGVNLGNNVIVGANSVVTKSFISNVVIGGNPAKIIKHL